MKTKQQIINDMKKEIDVDIRPKDGYIADIMTIGMEMGVTRAFFEMNEFISVTDSERLVIDVEKVLKNTSLFMSFPEIYPLLIKQNSYWNKRTEPSLAISFGMSWKKYSDIIGHDIVNGRLQSGNYTRQQSRYYIKGRRIHISSNETLISKATTSPLFIGIVDELEEKEYKKAKNKALKKLKVQEVK